MIKPIKDSSVRTHQKFDPTFKREAVANWLSSGKSASVIAQELGILPDRLYTWRKAFGPAEAGGERQPGRRPAAAAISRHNWTLPSERTVIFVSSVTF